MRILVVDDDPRIRTLVRTNLERRGFTVCEAADGSVAIQLMQAAFPDLILLDLSLPGGTSGIDVCAWVREQSAVPVIVISAHGDEEVKVQALDLGADDFVTKPFGYQELLARVRAVLRRVTVVVPAPPAPLTVDRLRIDPAARRIAVEGHGDLHLTRTEYALLVELARHAGSVLTHDELLERVWGREYRGASHYLHVYLGRLRKKLGPDLDHLLESVPGVGYVLRPSP